MLFKLARPQTSTNPNSARILQHRAIHKPSARTLFLILTSILTISNAQADELNFGFDGIRLYGVDAHVASGPWVLGFGAGYENVQLGRQTDGTPMDPPVPSSQNTNRDFWLPDAQVTFGPKLEVGRWTFWALTGVRGYGDLGLGEQAPGVFTDEKGGLYDYGQTGAQWDGRTTGPRGVVQGARAQFIAEGSPAVFSDRGTSYCRASVDASILIPLWNLQAQQHLFSGTLGFRGAAKYTDGKVPITMLDPTEVRGYYELFDAKFLTVATAELRIGLPSLLGEHDLVPVVLAFLDEGCYAGYAEAPSRAATRFGGLSSVGLGAGLNVFGWATPTFQCGLPLVGEKNFWWTVLLDLKF